jgi:hypothetical protein
MLPIVFFEFYLNMTVFLFAFGPWPWPVSNPIKLYGFLTAAHFALFLGYVSSVFHKLVPTISRIRASRMLFISVTLNLLLLPFTFLSRTGQVLPQLRDAVIDPGAAYSNTRIARSSVTAVFEYARILVAPWLFPLIPLTVFYWRGIGRKFKTMSMLAVVGVLSISLATGTNKGIADFVLLFPWLVLAAHFSGIGELSRKQWRALFLLFIFAFTLFIIFFTRGQMTRPGSGALSFYASVPGIYADTDNYFIRFLPFNAKVGITSLIGYLTQGYYALSLAIDRPFVPMFGIGNSMFLFNNFADLLGMESIRQMPYPSRIERFGWDAYGKWSSIYPWIASDVSFVGTIGILFLIGFVFGLSWLDTLNGTNPLAICVFSQFLIMLFYFPANNQVAQSGESFVSFYGLLVAWLLTRHVRRFRLGSTE